MAADKKAPYDWWSDLISTTTGRLPKPSPEFSEALEEREVERELYYGYLGYWPDQDKLFGYLRKLARKYSNDSEEYVRQLQNGVLALQYKCGGFDTLRGVDLTLDPDDSNFLLPQKELGAAEFPTFAYRVIESVMAEQVKTWRKRREEEPEEILSLDRRLDQESGSQLEVQASNQEASGEFLQQLSDRDRLRGFVKTAGESEVIEALFERGLFRNGKPIRGALAEIAQELACARQTAGRRYNRVASRERIATIQQHDERRGRYDREFFRGMGRIKLIELPDKSLDELKLEELNQLLPKPRERNPVIPGECLNQKHPDWNPRPWNKPLGRRKASAKIHGQPDHREWWRIQPAERIWWEIKQHLGANDLPWSEVRRPYPRHPEHEKAEFWSERDDRTPRRFSDESPYDWRRERKEALAENWIEAVMGRTAGELAPSWPFCRMRDFSYDGIKAKGVDNFFNQEAEQKIRENVESLQGFEETE